MLKSFGMAAFGCGLAFGVTALASAQTLEPRPPYVRYQLPSPLAAGPADRPYEGRSIYSVDPSRFPNHVDEKGNVSGMPENPQF